MYLSKRVYVGANYEHRNVKVNLKITAEGKPIKINPKRIVNIEEQVGYWRKANHIHAWFVQNVQNGEDDCKEYYVEEETLVELLEICRKIKKNHKLAPELLPTQSGFFFGNTNYNEYYFNDIDDTIKIIEGVLAEKEGNNLGGDIYYSSSW